MGDVVNWCAGTGGEGDLELERCQSLKSVGLWRRHRTPGGDDFFARAVGPGLGTELLEHLQSRRQMIARFERASRLHQP